MSRVLRSSLHSEGGCNSASGLPPRAPVTTVQLSSPTVECAQFEVPVSLPGNGKSGHMQVSSTLRLKESLFGPDIEFVVERELGKGVYGRVLQVRRIGTESSFALKEVLNEDESEPKKSCATGTTTVDTTSTIPPITTCSDIQQCALREVVLMKQFTHPNILRLHGLPMFDTHGTMYVGFELMSGGDLYHRLNEQYDATGTGFDMNTVRLWMHQLLSAMQALHLRNIYHRDLKPHNLLLSQSDDICVADFGLARSAMGVQAMTYTPTVITLWYRPLELLLGGRSYNSSVDMWSCGAIFYEMLTGHALFETTPKKHEAEDKVQVACIISKLGLPDERTWPGITSLPLYEKYTRGLRKSSGVLKHDCDDYRIDACAKDLLFQLLTFDPIKRPSASAALSHPFFLPLHQTRHDASALATAPAPAAASSCQHSSQ